MSEKTMKLKSGYSMPSLGLGTWQLTGDQCEETVKNALELGYRHIDTAEIYSNHHEIGKAIKGFDRSEIFLVSKVWINDLRRKSIMKACERALKQLGIAYLDLYLIHWPNPAIEIPETMAGLEELVENGMTRSIGISNFDIESTKEAISVSDIPISVNQVEFHTHLYQPQLLEFCKKNGIVITAYSPIARGEVLTDHTILEIAEKHGKTPAQVSLRWLVQHGMIVIPKSSSVEHLRENMGIFDWQLSRQDMQDIDSIGIQRRQVKPLFGRSGFRDRLIRHVPKGLISYFGNRTRSVTSITWH